MMGQVTSINWRYIGDAIPAFVTLMFIPFSYSAAYGLIAGVMVYTVLNGMAYLTKLISGVVPADQDTQEYWSRKLLSSSMVICLLIMLLSHTRWQRTLVCQGRPKHSRSSQWWPQERRLVGQKRHFILVP